MNLGERKDIILLILGFLLSIGAGVIGAYVQRRLDRRGERRPLNQLLNFGPDQLLFVFPHREEIAEAILPRTSTEDFLAMNNFISALLNIGWSRKIGVRDTSRVTEADKKRNLVIICSTKSNSLAAIFQSALEKLSPEAFSFKQGNQHRWHICDRDGATYQWPVDSICPTLQRRFNCQLTAFIRHDSITGGTSGEGIMADLSKQRLPS